MATYERKGRINEKKGGAREREPRNKLRAWSNRQIDDCELGVWAGKRVHPTHPSYPCHAMPCPIQKQHLLARQTDHNCMQTKTETKSKGRSVSFHVMADFNGPMVPQKKENAIAALFFLTIFTHVHILPHIHTCVATFVHFCWMPWLFCQPIVVHSFSLCFWWINRYQSSSRQKGNYKSMQYCVGHWHKSL